MNKLILMVACLILPACVHFKPPSDGRPDSRASAWAAHLKQLQGIEKWGLNGRIGSRAAYRANSASIVWQQQGEHYNIHLSGPLGQGSLSAKGESDFIEVRSAVTGVISSNNPQQLLNQELGWTFPLSQAKNWVLGNPGKPPKLLEEYSLDSYGRMTHFIDKGWEVHYHNYRQIGNISLPHKIVLKYLDSKIIVIVKNWKI